MIKVRQPGRYVGVVNASGEALTYPTHNRVKAMKDYVARTDADFVWMMDPDMVFVGTLQAFPEHGVAIGERVRHHWWEEIVAHEELVRKRFSHSPSRALAFTQVPWILTREDFARVVGRWDELIYEVYNDPTVLTLPGWNRWVTTSWCYWLVLAEFGIEQRVLHLAHFTCEDELYLPVIHYPHRMTTGFYKRDYEPWRLVDVPEDHHPLCERVTLETINEVARARGEAGSSPPPRRESEASHPSIQSGGPMADMKTGVTWLRGPVLAVGPAEGSSAEGLSASVAGCPPKVDVPRPGGCPPKVDAPRPGGCPPKVD